MSLLSIVPLFPGVPGGPELLVMLLMAILIFGLPLVLIALGGLLYYRRNERIEELERRIDELEAETED